MGTALKTGVRLEKECEEIGVLSANSPYSGKRAFH